MMSEYIGQGSNHKLSFIWQILQPITPQPKVDSGILEQDQDLIINKLSYTHTCIWNTQNLS